MYVFCLHSTQRTCTHLRWGGGVAGTLVGHMLQRTFPRVTYQFPRKSAVARTQFVFLQHVAWISAGLDSCFMNQEKNYFHFQCRIDRVHCLCKLSPLRHRNEPTSTSCTPVTHCPGNVRPIHICSCFLVSADLWGDMYANLCWLLTWSMFSSVHATFGENRKDVVDTRRHF